MESPPPTRGTQNNAKNGLITSGITPAYAGNTLFEYFLKHFVWDHPRLRGEHFHLTHIIFAFQGSPPPTRGTLLIVESLPMRPGITPAYAGNTTELPQYADYNRDHPRLRGEHHTTVHPAHLYLGSPPPTRGTLLVYLNTYFTFRITPAYAGNTYLYLMIT